MKRYDLHVHTDFSDCSINQIGEILRVAKRKGLSGLAITDHNTIKGALALRRLNKDKNFEIITGEEVSTELGHILIYFVKKTIKSGKFEEVIKKARKQKALIVLAHPFNIFSEKIGHFSGAKNYRGSVNVEDKRIKLLNGIEGLNGRCFLKKENDMAQKLAKRYDKLLTAGSDAHFNSEIGSCWVEFDSKYPLREAIEKGKIKLGGKGKNVLFHRLKSGLLKIWGR